MPTATDGYQVGNAFIQVLPSFRAFHRRLAAELAGIRDVHVDVEPEVSTKKAVAAIGMMDERLSKTPIVKRVDLDTREFNAKMALLNAKSTELKVRIDADISAAQAKIADLERRRGKTTINVDAEIAKAQAKIKSLEVQRDVIDIQVDVDVDKAERKLNQVERHLNRLSNNQTDINMEASDASRAVAVIGLLTAGLGVVGQLAPAAAAALAGIPVALAAAAQGVGAVIAGLSGISDATKALQAVEDEQASKSVDSARQRVSSANRVASAQSSLERALEQADRSAIDGARQVRDARDAAADAAVNAARRVEEAERSLTAAQQAAQDTQEALTRARKDAAESLEDLNRSVAGAALDEEAAVLAAERAHEQLDAARAAGVGGRDMQEISLAARQADQALAEVRDRYGDLREEADQANRAGVGGSREVVAAQRDAQEATQGVQDAERTLTQTRVDSAREVAKAQERVTQAQEQASRAAVDASRAVADAQRSIAEASITAGDTSSAAMDKAALAMSKLSPAGQVFALFLQNKVKPALRDVSGAVQGELLPRLQVAMDLLLTFAPAVKKSFAETGQVIGDLAIKGADMVTQGPWRADFGTIMARNNRILGMMGNAGLSALDAMRHLTIAAGPLVEALAASTQGYLDQFAAWLQGKRDSGELAAWFQEMSVRIREAFTTFGELAGGVINLLQALAPLGHTILQILGPIVQWLGAMAEANPALTTMIALAVLGTSTFVNFFRTLGGLARAFKTSSSVYESIKDSILGVRKATDEATTATVKNKAATEVAGATADRAGGLVGKLRVGLDNMRGSYTAASTATKGWVTTTTSGVGSAAAAMNGQLLPATQRAVQGLDNFPPAVGRVRQALGGMTTTAQTTLTNVAASVSGTVAAVSRGAAGAVSGLVGALGGPFGVAITAATVGLGFLISSQQQAAQAAAEHKAQIQTLTDALVESGGAIDENVRKQVSLDLKQRSINDNATHFGVNVGRMIDAITKGGDAAKGFEGDLGGVANQLISNNRLNAGQASTLRAVTTELLRTGGSAESVMLPIEQIANSWQQSTGASNEAKDAFKAQLIQFADLVGGYKNAKNDFGTASQDQKDIAKAQDDATSATDRHTKALKALQDQILAQIDKDLARRQSLQSLKEAQDRVEHATGDELPAALLSEEQAILDVIQKEGDYALAHSTATTEIGKQRDATLAQVQAAADLAAQYSGPLPQSLQTYLTQLLTAKTETGNYTYLLDQIPPSILTKVFFDGKSAEQGMIDLANFFSNQIFLIGTNFANNIVKGFGGGKALGGINIPAYAAGGVRPMSAKFADIVPPRQPRLIGDRMQGNEAFIPLNQSPRSVAILAEAASQMGYALLPLASGALLGMQAGGVNQGGTQAAGTDAAAALTVDAAPVDAFTAALQQLVAAGLVPLATEVTTATTPALIALEQHAGVHAVTAMSTLATAMGAAWSAAVQTSQAGVTAITGYLATLRGGLQQTGGAFAATADSIGVTWGKVRQYTADPVRAALTGPMNLGLIAAWNYLNDFFALGRPLAPVPIPFATGGEVPGVGNRDSIPALLTPGEYVISKAVVKKWGLKNLDAAHMATKRGGFPGLEGMLTGDDQGIFRVGYASGGPVPEALARATAFGRSMHGKPYIWGGSSEAGTDCSGWMSMLARALVDEKPYARREWATAVAAGGNPPPRFSRGIDGLFAIGVNPGVHTAGTLAGTNVESGGRHNYVAFGPPSTGADDTQFPLKFHLDALAGKFISGGTGGQFDLASFIRDSFNATHQQLAAYQEAWGANMMAQASAAIVGQATDAAATWAINNVAPLGTSGDAESWRPLVLQALRMLGLPQEWADITLRRIAQESGGNPRAVNLWDSNAQRGDPSKGLLQTIGSTFRAYRDPRAPDDVFDPLANILASMRYAMARYGSLPAGYGRAGGYDDGGILPPGYSSVYNGLSRPEMILTPNQWNSLSSLAVNNSGGGELHGNLYLSSGEFLGVVEGVVDRANTESGRTLARRLR